MRYKYNFFLLVVILFLCIPAFAECPKSSRPILDIEVNYGKIHYIHTKSSKDFPGKAPPTAMGLTVTDLQSRASGEAKVQSNQEGNLCVSLYKMKVKIGFPSVDIYIDKKYKKGTCNYKVIKEHENYHARVQQEGLKFFTPKIKEAYKIAANKVQPVEISSPDEAQEISGQMVRQVEAEVAPLIEYVKKRLQEENMVIDTEESYKEETSKCPSW